MGGSDGCGWLKWMDQIGDESGTSERDGCVVDAMVDAIWRMRCERAVAPRRSRRGCCQQLSCDSHRPVCSETADDGVCECVLLVSQRCLSNCHFRPCASVLRWQSKQAVSKAAPSICNRRTLSQFAKARRPLSVLSGLPASTLSSLHLLTSTAASSFIPASRP